MRWDELFGDLEGRLEAAAAAETAAEVSDRLRRELALVGLVDRLRPLRGARVGLAVRGVGDVRGVLREVGSTWLLLDEGPDHEVLVPCTAVLSVSGLTRASAVPGDEGRVVRRFGLSHVLRGLARDRSPVVITLVDGRTVSGTIDRVGADFIELAEHGLGEARRAREVHRVQAVAQAAIGVVRRW